MPNPKNFLQIYDISAELIVRSSLILVSNTNLTIIGVKSGCVKNYPEEVFGIRRLAKKTPVKSGKKKLFVEFTESGKIPFFEG